MWKEFNMNSVIQRLTSKKKIFYFVSIVCIFYAYWGALYLNTPYQLVNIFRSYSIGLFSLVVISYYIAYRIPGKVGILFGLGFTFIFFAFTLANKWQSAYSDNFLIGGLLPYKDAQNYYYGSNLIFNGLPLVSANQATERPLFPGFLSILLLITGNNLKISLGILTQLAAIGLYYSSRKVYNLLGPISASLFSTLIFLYIQPWIGYTMSEIFGFSFGCIAFSVLLEYVSGKKFRDLALGGGLLVIAVSARAGTFLIFPMLILWLGWIYRGNKNFSVKTFIFGCLAFILAYLLVNNVYPRLLGVPEGASFGNFSYALYGQVRGGTGWHQAIEDLGTQKPDIVYRAAFEFFQKHPLSLLIGVAKSYRDFFVPNYPNIFPFDNFGQAIWITYVLWLGIILALIRGLYHILKNSWSDQYSFFLAGFVGVMLSIPFLPPVDGGNRFYASTVPFFFVLISVGISFNKREGQDFLKKKDRDWTLRIFAGLLGLFTLVPPVLFSFLRETITPETISCPTDQKAFTISNAPGSYLDISPELKNDCGDVPSICLDQLQDNNVEYKIDDFYQKLYSIVLEDKKEKRLILALNFQDTKSHFFLFETNFIQTVATTTLSGCATEILTRNQSLYYVESIR